MAFFLQPFQDHLFSLAPFFRSVHHKQHHVHFLDGVEGRLDHVFSQFVLGFVETWGVQEHHLGLLRA